MSNSNLTIIPIGSSVIVGHGEIEATINEVLIRSNYCIQYKCSWWNDTTRMNEWLDEHEVKTPEEGIKQNVGFK